MKNAGNSSVPYPITVTPWVSCQDKKSKYKAMDIECKAKTKQLVQKPMLEVTFRQTPHAQSAYEDTGAFKSLNPKYTVKRGKIVTQSIRELP